MTGVHQFVRIGESAFTAANSIVTKDVPPFVKVAGDRARFVGVNTINLERRGFEKDRIATIKHAYHLLFQSKLPFEEACASRRGRVRRVARRAAPAPVPALVRTRIHPLGRWRSPPRARCSG